MIYRRRFEWIEYPDADPGNDLYDWNPDHAGFRARVLVNPNGAELREETKLFIASNSAVAEEQDLYWQGVAYRIPEWNLAIERDDGEIADVPPPADDWQSFLLIELDLAIWLRTAMHWAHRKKVLTALQKPISPDDAGTSDTTQSTESAPSNSSTPSS